MASGKTVTGTPAERPFTGAPMEGRFMTLEKMTREHLSDLWHHWNVDDSTWTWLPDGKPKDEETFNSEMMQVAETEIVWTLVGDPNTLNPGPSKQDAASQSRREAMGILVYGDIHVEHRALEAGAILGPAVRRTVAVTEAHYLFLRNVFDPRAGEPYRRVSWKTNSFNKASRRAAERLGYVYEGTWRNHMIDRGRSRDSTWLSMIDDDWPVIRTALEQWLDPKNFGEDGSQIRRLEDIRQSLK